MSGRPIAAKMSCLRNFVENVFPAANSSTAELDNTMMRPKATSTRMMPSSSVALRFAGCSLEKSLMR